MSGIILFAIVSPFVVWFCYWYYWVKHFEKYLHNIPGPKFIPLFGNALELKSTTSILQTMSKYMKDFKGNFKIYIGCEAHLFLCEPKDVELLLTSSTIIRKSGTYKFLRNWLGLSLTTSWGDRWRKHRKIITPAFHFKILEGFVDVFNSQNKILISKLEQSSQFGPIDIYPFIARYALDVICESAMGASVNAQNDLESEYVKCINELFEVFITRCFSPTLSNDFLYFFSKTYWRERSALKVVHGYTKSVINRRKAEYFAENRKASVDSFGSKRKQAFLDLLLEYSMEDPSFTEEDIRQEVDTFMTAAVDTTATSISFALYELAANPDIQRKTYDELQFIFADDQHRGATYRDLQEMKYLEMVIKESLRIYTPVPMFGRILEQDTDWNGMLLPKGLMVNIFAYGMQNSDIFKNPSVFDPERFNFENIQGRDPFIYVPFSAGPRNCIGQKFAMLEMKATISNILRNFELSPVPDHKIILKSEAVLKSDNGVLVELIKRK